MVEQEVAKMSDKFEDMCEDRTALKGRGQRNIQQDLLNALRLYGVPGSAAMQDLSAKIRDMDKLHEDMRLRLESSNTVSSSAVSSLQRVQETGPSRPTCSSPSTLTMRPVQTSLSSPSRNGHETPFFAARFSKQPQVTKHDPSAKTPKKTRVAASPGHSASRTSATCFLCALPFQDPSHPLMLCCHDGSSMPSVAGSVPQMLSDKW
eukprot:TRINITY_DN39174_c0_g1_i1.p1 TRINITY_DN39174_c0_g1~~TRINITY_DN39174_c0_g1_i1.p1  ORF type:complete len:206 (+),score=16.25 TRINITY_DN39174_c0_g1_i1:349-966(+)